MAAHSTQLRSSLSKACLINMTWQFTSLFLIFALFASAAGCGVAQAQPGAKSAPANRSRVIDFEDEVVEGMNKRPLDSLNQVSERDRRKRQNHLYRKRAGFKTETRETLRSLRNVQ